MKKCSQENDPNCNFVTDSDDPDENFCSDCGSPLINISGSADNNNSDKGLDFISDESISSPSEPGYLTWNTGFGEIARKITEKELTNYLAGLKGFIVGPGQSALIYGGGKLLAELSGGTYDFPSRPAEEIIGQREGGVAGCLTGAGRAIANFFLGTPKEDQIKDAVKINANAQMKQFIDHLKSGRPFSIFVARKAPFDLSFTINEVQTADIRTDLGVLARCVIKNFEKLYSEFLTDCNLLKQSELQDAIVSRLVSATEQSVLSLKAQEIEANPSLRNQLLQSFGSALESTLQFVSIERITVEHEEIQGLRKRQEDLVLAEKNLEGLINANDFANRLQLEENRRGAEEAANQEEFMQQMQAINKDGLLREEDLEIFERSIAERTEDHGISRAHALDLVRETNRQEIEEKLRSREIVTLDHELELEKKRRVFDREQEEEDGLAGMRMVSRLQDINKQKEQNELEIESSRKERDHRMDLEKTDQIKDLDVDKIMLLNPNLDRETAMAMLEKQARVAEAQAQSSVSEEAAQREIDRSRETTEMMKDFMENQQSTMVQLAGGQTAAKEKEIDRIQKSAEKQEERLSNVVGNTVDAFKGNAAEATVKGSQSAPAGGEVLYNIAVGKDDKGRHSLSAISEMISSGQFDPQCKVWTKGMSDWKPAVVVPEIADLLDSGPPPIPDDGPPPL